ncbi:MAG: bifunctional folylpolyglutamate synthase/dihydrofolate synthase [Anaerolineae bacterium]|nr:bifunctional folylpolyglutamate synthase/dihydrofolate synthase [Anaerolineae bacterium]
MPAYEQSLARLERFANYELNRTVPYTPGTFDLGRMRALLARLGDPHRAYPTVHIAGSKGKGSTAAMTEAILRSAGYRTGLYISPHLHSFGERIQVAGVPIAEEEFAGLVDEVLPHVEAVPDITWFELITALAFLHYARQRVDLAVIEVGLGGRLDATNVITPLASVITSLSYEHTAWLGNTLAQIAFEKAGIIKPNVPAISAPQADEALAVIERACTERKAPLILVGRDWLVQPGPLYEWGQSFAARPPAQVPPAVMASGWCPDEWLSFDLPLIGRHQLINAGCALAAVAQVTAAGWPVSVAAAAAGLRAVRWPGRGEVLARHPLVVADGAHNGDSARRLAEMLTEWFPGRRWTFIVGTLSDKDHAAILRELIPLAARLLVTRPRSGRATDPGLLSDIARRFGMDAVIVDSVPTALERALTFADAVCLTGSLTIAAEAREAWAAR